MIVPVTRWIAVAVLAAATSAAHADPKPMIFRALRWSVNDLSQHQLTTYALTRERDTVTLQVEFSTGTRSRDGLGPWTWKIDHTDTYSGTVRMVNGATVLDLMPGDDKYTYSCKAMTVHVAPATARRDMIRGHERLSNGRWLPGTTTRSNVLFCNNVTNGAPGQYPFNLHSELVFSPRGIEHVIADDNCCRRPGDSLRWIPTDRSITPGRD